MEMMRNDAPLISVLMSTYNEPVEYIRMSVSSILKQTYREIEFVIIVDDPTNNDVISYLTNVQESDERVNIYINEKNCGLVNSLNRGIKKCHGEYIARMDADDISSEHRLQRELNFLSEKGYDLVSANILSFSDINNVERIKFPEDNEKCVRMLQITNCLPHPCWLGKKDVFLKLHGYRNIDCCEDYDFVIRAIESGFKVGNCQDYLLRYRTNDLGISRTKYAIQMTITDYISRQYRRNKETTYQAYLCYLDSEKFKNQIKSYEKYEALKEKYKGATRSIEKFFWAIQILFDSAFWKTRIKELRIDLAMM